MLSGMKAPKILAVASAVDLDFRYGCTPAWWQLWKGLYEVGVDLIVTPYRGRPVESPWWRTASNPDLPRGRELRRRPERARAAKGRPLPAPRRGAARDSAFDRYARGDLALGHAPLAPAPEQVLERERDVDAVIVFTVPMATSAASPPTCGSASACP